MAEGTATFGDLPTELIESLLYYLSPEALCTVRAVSKRLLHAADNPLLWRYHCRTQYRFWDPSHAMWRAWAEPVDSTDWKSIFIDRRATDKRVNTLLNEVIASPRHRIARIESICTIKCTRSKFQHSYDVKDALLVNCNAPEWEEDFLARRYWAKAVLERLHRSMAIEQWKSLRHHTVDLDRALASFDMFIIGTDGGDIDDIHKDLDTLAAKLLAETGSFHALSTRRKAVALSNFLKDHGFIGVDSEGECHNLQNNFLSKALRDPKHQALPLVCAVVYCCIASRVGLFARPCGFPMHVYAIVVPPDGKDLDDRDVNPDLVQERIYVDAFRSAVDIPVSQLKSKLRRLGVRQDSDDLYLGPASTLEITLRNSRNIMHSVQILQNHAQLQASTTNGVRVPTWATVSPDVDSAFYATLWAICLLHDHSSSGNAERRQYLPFLCEHFQTHFPWDVQLVREHIAPLFRSFPETAHFVSILRNVSESDSNAIQQKKRGAEIDLKVRHRVGQVFRHRRYGYEGIVVGWDTCCGADDSWVHQMGVDNLEGGRAQSFYHVLADDKSSRYVAEENIVLADAEPSQALLSLAGRYFKRYDSHTRMFVSNIKAEYPDD